jgi:hypothetical protein
MAITTNEFLSHYLDGLESRRGFASLVAEEVVPFSANSSAEEVIRAVNLFTSINAYPHEVILSWHEEVFAPLAKVVMNLISVNESLDLQSSSDWGSVISVGAKAFLQYTQATGQDLKLAHDFSEAIRRFKNHRPEWLHEAIVKFHRKRFDDFDVDTLCEIARSSNDLRSGFGKESGANHVYSFCLEADMWVLRNEGLYNNPFICALMITSMSVASEDAPKYYRSPSSNLYKGLHQVCGRLLRLEGQAVSIPCNHTDYLLVGQLIDRFRKLHAAIKDPARRDEYVRACAVLVDLVVMKNDQPLDWNSNLYLKRPGGQALLRQGEIFTREFADLFDAWPTRSPFKASMERLRQAVVGSTLLAMRHRPGYFKETAEGDVVRMLKKSGPDLKNPAFLSFIKKPGRLAIAERIGTLGDPELKKEFLKASKDSRGSVLEADLGL